jgi:hypothetical protein
LSRRRLEVFTQHKLGMRVIQPTNLDIDAELVNGSQGASTRWQAHSDSSLLKTHENKDKSWRGMVHSIQSSPRLNQPLAISQWAADISSPSPSLSPSPSTPPPLPAGDAITPHSVVSVKSLTMVKLCGLALYC